MIKNMMMKAINHILRIGEETELEIIKKFNVSKSECIYIGDSNVDVMTARNSGIKCIGVSWGFRGKEELAKAQADYLADNTIELKNIIINY